MPARAKSSTATGQRGRKLSEDAQRLERRARAWDLRCKKGWDQRRIAKELGVSQATVCRDLRWAADRALEDLKEDVKRVKAEHVARLDVIIEEAMAAWEDSKEEAVMISQKSREGQSSAGPGTGPGQSKTVLQPVERTTQVKAQVGDPAYLDRVMAAMKQIREILGADAPVKIAQTDPSGEHAAPAPGTGVVVIIPHNDREPLSQVQSEGVMIGDPNDWDDSDSDTEPTEPSQAAT